MPCTHLWDLMWDHVCIVYASMTSNMKQCIPHVCIIWHLVWDHLYVTYEFMTSNMRSCIYHVWHLRSCIDHEYIYDTYKRSCTHHVCIFSFLGIVQKKQRMQTSNNKCLSGVKGDGGKEERWAGDSSGGFQSASIGIPAQCYVGTGNC